MIIDVSKLAAFLLCFSALSIFAQEATIIKNDNDTIQGLIDYSEVLKTPKRIAFRTRLKDEKQYFTPNQIKSFIIKSENLLYETAPIKINSEKYKFESARMYNSLSEAINDIRWREDTLFLLTLAKGKINLYEYVDEFDESHFIINKEKGVYETLLNLRFKLRIDSYNRSTSGEAEIEHYKTQLKVLLSDCPSVEVNARKLTYNSLVIQTLVNQYNACSKNVIYSKPTKRYQPHFYFAGGATKPKTRIIDYFGGKNFFEASVQPNMSVCMEFDPYSTHPIPKFGVAGLELNITSLRINDSVDYAFLGRRYYYDLKAVGINLIPYFLYNYKFSNAPNHKSAIYAKGGPIVSFYPGMKFNDERYSRLNLGFLTVLGYRWNRYFVEGRYEPSGFNVLPPDLSTSLSQARFSIMAGYYFK